MRKLLITLVRRPGAAPVIVSAIVAPAACDADPDLVPIGGGGAGGATSVVSSSSTSSSSSGFAQSSQTSTGSMPDICGGFPPETFTVELPPPGTPANVGQLCGAPQAAVDSYESARVTLTVGAQSHLATGRVDVPPGVLSSVVGTPLIEAIEASIPALLPVAVTNVAPVPGGFSCVARASF